MKVEKIVSIETREHSFTVGSDFVLGPKREKIMRIEYTFQHEAGNGYLICGANWRLFAFIPVHAVQILYYDTVEK